MTGVTGAARGVVTVVFVIVVVAVEVTELGVAVVPVVIVTAVPVVVAVGVKVTELEVRGVTVVIDLCWDCGHSECQCVLSLWSLLWWSK